MSATGLMAMPGSGDPKPESVAVAVAVLEAMVRVPVVGPVPVGVYAICKKHEALGASGPEQVAPPVVALLTTKSPGMAGAERSAAVAVRLVRVKSLGSLELWRG